MSMYSLLQYSDIYRKTSGSLWKTEKTLEINQYYTILLITKLDNNIIYFPADNNNNSILFEFKQQITGKAGNGDRKHGEIMVLLK